MKLPLLNMDPFKHQVCLIPIVLAFISFLYVPLASAYCWEIGRNPYFTAKPVVQQVDLRTVRVSWNGLVESVECADQFLVKYWPRNSPQDWIMTDLIQTDQFSTEITVTPKLPYVFQVIAREDKGSFAGIDYNKSDQTEFKTSAFNKNVSPTPKPKAPSPPSGGKPTEPATSNEVQSPPSKVEDIVPREETVVQNNKLFASLSVELMAVIVVCSVVLLLIFVGLIYKLACAKKTEDIDDDDEEEDEDDEDHFEKERLDV